MPLTVIETVRPDSSLHQDVFVIPLGHENLKGLQNFFLAIILSEI